VIRSFGADPDVPEAARAASTPVARAMLLSGFARERVYVL